MKDILTLTPEKNLELLEERVKAIKIIPEKKILICDWDECVVKEHEARKTTKSAFLFNEKELPTNPQDTFEGIEELNSGYYGLLMAQYNQLLSFTWQMSWREGFDTAIKSIINKKKLTLVFITSGLKDIPIQKLRKFDFPPVNVIGNELEIQIVKQISTIVASSFIMFGELKATAVKMIKEKSQNEIIGFGHSAGDLLMLGNCDKTIALGHEIEADFHVETAKQFLSAVYPLTI